jgi:tetratricopeptide (TPR) repeat protein
VEQKRPEWATEAVPDTIVTLVERAADTNDGDLRKDLLREAETHAREAVGADDQTGRRYALAVVLGLRANAEGGKTKVQAAAALSDELDVILEREPDHAGARHMLGRLHAGVRRMSRITRWLATNLMGGDALSRATWAAAEENLAYAEERAPHVADHHLQLALLYRDTGRPELAAEEVAHVLAIEPRNALEQAVLEEALLVRSELGQ